MQRIQILSSIPFEFPIFTEPALTYQNFPVEARKLKKLGMSFRAMGTALGVDYKVVIKTLSPR